MLLPLLFIVLSAQAHSEKNEPKFLIPVEASVLPGSLEDANNYDDPRLAPASEPTQTVNPQKSDTLVSGIAIDNSFVEEATPKSRNKIFSVRLTPPEVPDTGCEDCFILYPGETIILEEKSAQSDGPDSMILLAAEAKELSTNKVGYNIEITNNKLYKVEFNYSVEGDTIVLDVFQSPVQ